MENPNKPAVAALTAAVEKLHGVPAVFVGTREVHERHNGQTVWKGTVSLFSLTEHPLATQCYAWSVPASGEARERFYAVLHTAEVDTPEKAVRASIVADARAKRA